MFEDSTKGWNLQNFPSLLSKATLKYEGIQFPFLYVGSIGTIFPLHVEDYNLISINYLHWGALKIWYIIPGSHRKQVERILSGKYMYKMCSNISVSMFYIEITANISYYYTGFSYF